MATVGSLVVNLLGNTSHFRREFSAIPGMIRNIAASAASLIGIGAGFAAIGQSLGFAAAAERAQTSFEVLTGSAEKAKQALTDLRAYADLSPYSFVGVTETGRLLLNFGISAGQIMPTLRMLGDIAGGDEQKLHSLALAFGQSSSAGRLMGQDLNQMINAGFNPLQEISKRTGESMAALKARMEAGQISTAEVTQAFRDATSAGGRFYGMTDKQSKTLSGLWSTLKDTVVGTLTVIGAEIASKLDLKGVLQSTAQWLTYVSELVKAYGGSIISTVAVLGGMAAGILAVRAAALAWSAIQSVLIMKELTLKALMGPHAWLQVAAGLAAAALVANQLQFNFAKVEREAMKAAAAARNVKLQDPAASPAVSGMEKLIALQQRMRELAQVATHSPALAGALAKREFSAANLDELLGIKQTGSSAEEASPKVQLLRQALSGLLTDAARAKLPTNEIAEWTQKFQEGIRIAQDEHIGVTAAIAKEREELERLRKEADPFADRKKFAAAGASEAALAEFDAIKQQKDELKEQMKLRDEIARKDEQRMQDLQSRADALRKSTMTAAERQAEELRDIQELFIAGFIDEETYNKAVEGIDKKKTKSANDKPLDAILKGSKEYGQAIARAMGGGERPNQKLESLTEQGNRLLAEGNKLTKEIATRDEPTESIELRIA